MREGFMGLDRKNIAILGVVVLTETAALGAVMGITEVWVQRQVAEVVKPAIRPEDRYNYNPYSVSSSYWRYIREEEALTIQP